MSYSLCFVRKFGLIEQVISEYPDQELSGSSPIRFRPFWEQKWAHGDSPTKLGIKVDADRCENQKTKNFRL